MNPRWLLFRSWVKSILSPAARERESTFADAGIRASQEAAALLKNIVSRERIALSSHLQASGHDLDETTIRWFEKQFIWGVLHEFVKNGPAFPTNGYDRIIVFMIGFFVREWGLSLDEARVQALSVRDLFNQADEFFEAAESLGRKAFHGESATHYVAIANALHSERSN